MAAAGLTARHRRAGEKPRSPRARVLRVLRMGRGDPHLDLPAAHPPRPNLPPHRLVTVMTLVTVLPRQGNDRRCRPSRRTARRCSSRGRARESRCRPSPPLPRGRHRAQRRRGRETVKRAPAPSLPAELEPAILLGGRSAPFGEVARARANVSTKCPPSATMTDHERPVAARLPCLFAVAALDRPSRDGLRLLPNPGVACSNHAGGTLGKHRNVDHLGRFRQRVNHLPESPGAGFEARSVSEV